MNKSYSLVVLALFVGSASVLSQSTVTFSDGTFDNSNWSLSTAFNSTAPGEAASSASQVLSNGNPGAFRQTTLTYGHGTLGVAQLSKSAVFNPATQGKISCLDYSYDFIKLFPVGLGAVNYMLAVEQGGVIFHDAGEAPGNGTWTTFQHSGLAASNFLNFPTGGSDYTAGTMHPDFSASASPLQFGYITLNDDPAGPDQSISGSDNWTVTLHVIPPIPWLQIAVSQVQVTEHVQVGLNYVLQTSNDLKNWTPIGSQFTAQTNVVTQEFSVGTVGAYFRVQQVP